ncbi:MAG: CDP-diacylglycerol--glycerol-3-phosphate 3-phosphatidyltransferase [Leptospirales bacterium]|nr:CDP-diacylglycerol--glycerol-3-phosphate 3-phosphatidyltransferase [Leptospirales bacterium]
MNRIWTIPNILTFLRFLTVPIFIFLLLQKDQASRLAAFALFAAASITDFIDGYLARRLRQESELGKFMDPLADKALVTAALLTFISMSVQVQMWMVLCIIGRDLLITVLRYLAVYRGQSLRTSRFGKFKTAFQMFSILAIIITFVMISYRERDAINASYEAAQLQGISAYEVALGNLRNFSADRGGVVYQLASFSPYFLMLLTTFMTLISGIRYLITNYQLFLPPYNLRRKTSS